MSICSVDVNVNLKSMPSDDVMGRILKLETNMASALDVVNGLVPHIDALEQRDAVHTQALADLKTQVEALQAASANAPPEVVAAVDAIAARLDKVDQDAPPVPPPGGVTTEPSTG